MRGEGRGWGEGCKRRGVWKGVWGHGVRGDKCKEREEEGDAGREERCERNGERVKDWGEGRGIGIGGVRREK